MGNNEFEWADITYYNNGKFGINSDVSKINKFMLEYLPDVKKIIVNKKATVLIFKNGEKSIVKLQHGDVFDTEKGILFAYAKHHAKKVRKFHALKKELVGAYDFGDNCHGIDLQW